MNKPLKKLAACLLVVAGLATNTFAQWEYVGTPGFSEGVFNFSIPANAQLTNVAGQVVANKTNTNSLDLTNLPSGVYFLTLTNDNRQIIQRSKIVRE